MADKVEIISMNVRGLGQDVKRRKMFTWLQKQNIPIILMQETHSVLETENKWRAEWGGDVFFSHGANNARGTAIFLKPEAKNIEVHKTITDKEGRYIILDLSINDIRLTLGNVYGPNIDDPNVYREFLRKIDDFPQDNRIIGGDYNLVLNLEKDKEGGVYRTHKKAQEVVMNYMENTDMIDIWRKSHGNKKQFTYSTDYPTKISCRLDFFLTSSGLTQQTHRTSITHGYLTDHNSVRMILNTKIELKGPGFWKLNTSLLQDKDYVDLIKQVIQETVEDNQAANPQLLWDVIKLQCRGKTIQYSSRKKKNQRNIILLLEKKIQDLEAKELDEPNVQRIEQIRKLKQDLDIEVENTSKGSFIRSRARWNEQGEKSNQYFLNLEKRNYNKKSIQKLNSDNGISIQGKTNILEEIERFYTKLYKSKRTNLHLPDSDKYFQNEAPKLTEDQKELGEELITENELLAALKHTKNNKTPGSDGFPCEFYKVFWQDIKNYLVKSINHGFTSGSLSITQKHGVITLLPKPGRDTIRLKNWRPITLLNQDYKLIAKVLSFRLKNILPTIINADQTGFVKNRYIGENITRIFNIMDYVEEEDISAIIMSIDYEKAFDSLEWDFIAKTLTFFNFGENLKKWVKMLYTDISSCVVNNGWTTKAFKPSRGVRQGCPMSPYLYILCAEIFAVAVRANADIKGIKIGTETHKIIQFADDTALTLKYEEHTLEETYILLREFALVSGLAINLDKTIIMRIGRIKNSGEILLPQNNVQWTSDSIKLLGIVIPNDRTRIVDLNYIPKLKKIENTIKVWKQRNLTIYGRVQLIKTYLVSQIIYLLSILPAPPLVFIKQLETLLFKFLWNDKTERIKRSTLHLAQPKGGIAMPHLPSFNYAIKLAWLKRYLDKDNSGTWKSLITNIMPISEDYIWNCSLSIKDIDSLTDLIKNNFWKEVVQAWSVYNFHDINIEDISNDVIKIVSQHIWFNSFIKVGNKVIFYRDWYRLGVKTIEDLLVNGTFMTYEQFINRYHINTNYLIYYGLLSAIPRQWKQKLNNNYNNNEHEDVPRTTMQKLLVMKKVCKGTYSIFLECSNSNQLQLQGIAKWETELHMSVEGNIEIIFNNIYNSTMSTRLRACQYQTLHKALVTNVDLMKWNLKDTEECTFCREHPETLKHLLIDCTITSILWKKIISWLKRNTGIDTAITSEDIIFGCKNEQFILYDLVFIVAKRYIYVSRCKEKQPAFVEFLYCLRSEKETEYECAKMYSKMERYEAKWGPLTGAFDNM